MAAGLGAGDEKLFNGYRVSVLQDEEFCGWVMLMVVPSGMSLMLLTVYLKTVKGMVVHSHSPSYLGG